MQTVCAVSKTVASRDKLIRRVSLAAAVADRGDGRADPVDRVGDSMREVRPGVSWAIHQTRSSRTVASADIPRTVTSDTFPSGGRKSSGSLSEEPEDLYLARSDMRLFGAGDVSPLNSAGLQWDVASGDSRPPLRKWFNLGRARDRSPRFSSCCLSNTTPVLSGSR